MVTSAEPHRRAYSLGERAYDGSRAKVFHAVRTSDGRPILLEILAPEFSRAEDRERLKNEYEIGRTLAGLAVIEPLQLSTFDGRPALELEDVRGDTLERVVTRPMPIGEFLELAVRLTSVVGHIHARGVIHKDLKPAHIFFDPASGETKIFNFSIAARVAREQVSPRSMRMIEGSLPYMAPEQTGRMNRAIDSRSDLYSLGVIFYELLTGRLPFDAEDVVGWVHCHVARKPKRPDAIRPELPAILSKITLKLLAKVPDDRYQSASGLRRDLERCLTEWRRSGVVTAFPLGQHDISDRFLVPQRLYGRQSDYAALCEALARVTANGTPELVLVSGYSGIGKSTLVSELHRPIVGRRGIFISGKFEQYKREIPYLTVIQALGELALDLLAEGEPRISAWRERLAQALGPNGKLIADLVPQLGRLMGPQPTVPELPPRNAEVRLHTVFRRLFGALATAEHPLTMFVDDLQWADFASLKLLEDLMGDDEVRDLLVVGAYRDNEVSASHPLIQMLDRVRGSGACVRSIVLGPLSDADVSELVADTLHAPRDETASLAALVSEKTGGNPFFAIQFLTMLHRQGSIWFDHDVSCWRWDVGLIRAEGYTDNVVELMIRKLRGLPAETQKTLELAACIGGTFDADTLAIVCRGDPAPALRSAIEEELLLLTDRTYRFPHDRVQEAAYALIPEDERARVHLEIGRLLSSRTTEEELGDRIFEIVNQLDRGASLMTSREERERLAEKNLLAGNRAKASAAYASALDYFVAGAALLAEDCWERQYELTFALTLRCAECELLTGALEAAETRLAMLASQAKSIADAAAVTCVRVDLYVISERPDLGVEACLEYLRRIGVRWSPHPSDEETRDEYERIWRSLGSRPIEALAQLPKMVEPVARATMDVLTSWIAAAWMTDDNLANLSIARMANLSIEHGNCDASCLAYVNLGARLALPFGDSGSALRFARVGLDLVDQRGFLQFKARVYYCFGRRVVPGTMHLRNSIDFFRRASEAAQASGDLQYSSYSSYGAITHLLAAGAPLDEVARHLESALALARKTKFGLFVDIFITLKQLVRVLQGRTRDVSSFDDDAFDEGPFERRLESDPLRALGTCRYWISKLQGRFLSGNYGAALEAASKVPPLLWTIDSHFETAEYHFYRALALALAARGEGPPDDRESRREAICVDLRQLELWAQICRENFADRAALVAAELARLDGEPEKAAELYERAIRAARESEFVHIEAIAYETAARFYRACGFELIAETYLREAKDRYQRWGAEGKARELERLNAQLAPPKPVESADTLALRGEQVDLLSVIKASQTISGVMLRDELLRTLLRVVIEEGGARRARLVLSRESELEVAAELAVDEDAAQTQRFATGGKGASSRVPKSILDYVQRTEERVLLDDALADAGRFASDPYFAFAHPRSVLCLPIRRQAEIVALLYLENDLVPGAFTPEHLIALELLAAQAAISLENALLLEREHTGRVEAEAAEQRAVLLGEATAIMSSTLDYEGVFGTLTRLCARSFADWAVIDLDDAGTTVRLAGAHRAPEKESLLRELAEHYPARPGTALRATKQFESGAPIQLASLSDEELRAFTVDAHHAELLRRLGTKSVICVPLVARGTRLGALTLVGAAPNKFGPGDFELAMELGRRFAMAIDNARLLADTRRALRLREEFLALASHELRTPLTSLRMGLEILLQVNSAKTSVSPEAMSRTLDRVMNKLAQLERLTSELVDVTCIEQGRLVLHRGPIELGALVRRVVEQLDLEFAKARCAVSVDCDEPVTGIWDSSRLEQVLMSLLTNAMKFGAQHPIEVRIREVDGIARLDVADHGIGIDRSRLPHVFDRFERAVPLTNYGGLGLGLYIARAVVVAHGGTIDVESELGIGSTFHIALPCRAPD
ncbi:MAG TPA: AAA family ATPase [Labilithrix sp.]|nr:AAA family ATPase [Labilithrix sp.]